MCMRRSHFTSRAMVVVMVVGVDRQHVGRALAKKTKKFRVFAHLSGATGAADMIVEAVYACCC